MKLYLKITANLLLTVHVFHLASLEESTDSPGYTINKDWLREVDSNAAERQNTTLTEGEAQYDSGSYNGTVESSINDSGTASGSITFNSLEEENVLSDETEKNNGSDVVTITLLSVSNSTTKLPELSNTTVTITTTSTTNQSPLNLTETKEESYDSTTNSTTSSPADSTTQKSTSTNDTGLHLNTTTTGTTTTSTTTTSTTTTSTTTTTMISTTSNTDSTTTTLPPAVVNTPEKVNRTALGSDAERGLVSDAHSSKRNGAWTAILGTGVAVACVGLVAYIILRKKRQRDFSHRKLVEEFHPDPVLRLDNSEPLDLNFGGGAYYNPGLQGDNIQMSNFSGHHRT